MLQTLRMPWRRAARDTVGSFQGCIEVDAVSRPCAGPATVVYLRHWLMGTSLAMPLQESEHLVSALAAALTEHGGDKAIADVAYRLREKDAGQHANTASR